MSLTQVTGILLLTKTGRPIAAGLPSTAIVLQVAVLPTVPRALALTHVPVTGVGAVPSVQAGDLLAPGGHLSAELPRVARGTDTARGQASCPGETRSSVLTVGLAGDTAAGAGIFPVVT